MRSLHFVHSFSTLTETFVYDYVINLEKHCVDTHVMTFNRVNEDTRPFKLVHRVSLPLLNPERMWMKTKALLQGKPFETSAWPLYRRKIKEVIRQIQPDVIHAHFGPMGVLLAPVSSEMNLPLVVTFYGYDISEYARDDYWKNEYRRLANIADIVTVLSEQMKTDAIEIGFSEDQLDVVHLGTDINAIKQKQLSAPVRRFLSVGRLSEKKGHLDSVKALHQAIQLTNLPIHLDIIGGGKEKKSIANYIQTNNLQNHVHLLGKKSHMEVINHLTHYDAFILSSKIASNGDKEGTPTVLIEALAAGLPCISTFHSGIPEIIPKEDHDLLAPEGDINSISNRIQKLITESKEEVQQRGDRGRQKVEKAFDIKKEALKFKTIYESLI